MPSTYTTSLRLTLPATGELAGTWGATVNAGVTSLAEAAIAGTASIAMIDADYTLSTANGASDQARNMFVTLTGTLTAARNVICPSVSKLYFVTNNTTGGYAITFKTLAGTGVSVPNGFRAAVYCNGTDVVGGITALASLALSGSLTLSGGTANGVAYLNGSKALTTGTALTFDGTNFATTGTASATKMIPTGNSVAGNGMYLPTANTLAWSNNGAETMRLDSSGNLGIGTSSPGVKLDVNGSGAVRGSLVVGGATLTAGALDVISPVATNAGATGFRLSTDTGNTAATTLYTYGSAYSGPSLYSVGANGSVWRTPANAAIDLGASSFFAIGQNNTERMRLDASGNLGLGVTPSAWSGYRAFQVGAYLNLAYNAGASIFSANNYWSGANWIYQNANFASQYQQFNGQHLWFTAPSGIAGNAITFTQAMTLDASGNLGIGATSPGQKLIVQGGMSVTGSATLPAAQATMLFSYEHPVNRCYLGDGTGYSFAFSKRAASTTTDLMVLNDSGNLGLGVTPSAWSATYKAYELPTGALWGVGPTSIFVTSNAYNNGTNYIYKASNAASQYQQSAGVHYWSTAASGTAGNTFTFTTVMTLDANGNLGVGTGSPNAKLTAGGNSSANTTPDIQITRSSSGTTVQTGPNITLSDGTTNNTVALQATQGRFGVWNYGSGSWNERVAVTPAGNVGIGTASPANTLSIVGSFGRGAPVTKSANFTLAATENWIIHTGAGSITCTLPAASSCTGREVYFSTYGQNIVSSASNIAVLDSGTVGTSIISGTTGQRWMCIVSDGTNWIQMMRGT